MVDGGKFPEPAQALVTNQSTGKSTYTELCASVEYHQLRKTMCGGSQYPFSRVIGHSASGEALLIIPISKQALPDLLQPLNPILYPTFTSRSHVEWHIFISLWAVNICLWAVNIYLWAGVKALLALSCL